jgi:hypothetical protein
LAHCPRILAQLATGHKLLKRASDLDAQGNGVVLNDCPI